MDIGGLDDFEHEASAVVDEMLMRHEGSNEAFDWFRIADAAQRDLESDLQAGGSDLYELNLWQAVTHELRRRGMRTVVTAST